MSIQRYRSDGQGDCDLGGVYVLYADYVAALRSCEARVLDAAREAVMRTCGHTKYEGCSPCAHDDALAAIDGMARGGQVRHYMTDPDNEERLLKIPPSVVAEIQAEADQRTRQLMIAECSHHQDLAVAAALWELREAVAALMDSWAWGDDFGPRHHFLAAINELLADTHITNITKEPNDG